MKRIIITSIALLCFSTSSLSQAFPEPSSNPQWIFSTWEFWGGQCHRDTIKTGETLDLCGEEYTELIQYDADNSPSYRLGYYHIDDEKVFVRPLTFYYNGQEWLDSINCEEASLLVYDFTLSEQDTVMITLDLQDPTKFWSVANSYQDYEGINRLKQSMDYIPHLSFPSLIYNMDWIRGVGSNIHPFYPLSCIGDHCEWEQKLYQLVVDNNIIYHDTSTTFTFPCTSWVDIEEIEKKHTFRMYPNPTTNKLNIEFEHQLPISISILNSIGKKLQTETKIKRTQYILLNDYQSGVYFIQLQYLDKISTHKILILK